MKSLDPPSKFLHMAWELALDAEKQDEVPVGAVICEIKTTEDGSIQWEVIGSGQNRILEMKDPTAHAELLAIQNACKRKGSERLENAIMISTLEPCLMCSGAAILARLEAIYYFAPLNSGIGLKDILLIPESRQKPLNHRPNIHLVESYQNQAETLLQNFFEKKRKRIRTEYT